MAHDHDHDHDHDQGHTHAHGHGAGHDHDHGHDHGLGGGHGHHHHAPPAGFDVAFALGSALNGGFVAAQVVAGVWAHSTALLADAVHNLGDVLGLLLAWGAAVLARRAPSALRTYGWGRSTVLAALANAALVLIGCGAILLEGIEKLAHPQPVAAPLVMVVAAVGIAVNGVTAWLFARGRHGDLNVRAAFLHMMGDAAVSAGVVVAALLVALTGMVRIDAVASLVIVAVVVAGTWRVGRDSINLALDAVPDGIDTGHVADALRRVPGVSEVHDLHVWALSTTVSAMTAHLVRTETGDTDSIVRGACDTARILGIAHATVQVETGALARDCRLRPEEVV